MRDSSELNMCQFVKSRSKYFNNEQKGQKYTLQTDTTNAKQNAGYLSFFLTVHIRPFISISDPIAIWKIWLKNTQTLSWSRTPTHLQEQTSSHRVWRGVLFLHPLCRLLIAHRVICSSNKLHSVFCLVFFLFHQRQTKAACVCQMDAEVRPDTINIHFLWHKHTPSHGCFDGSRPAWGAIGCGCKWTESRYLR